MWPTTIECAAKHSEVETDNFIIFLYFISRKEGRKAFMYILVAAPNNKFIPFVVVFVFNYN